MKKSGLENEYGQNVALKSVHMQGRLEGLMLSMTLRQRYLNDSEETIEATYTFPVGWGVHLMGMSVEINGKRMESTALAKKTAEKKYESAIESGDLPVMLENSGLGLYTANLGNLKAGEELLIEIQYVQLLRFDKGRIRVTLPTVMGARYGDAQVQGGLFPHQTTETDALVEYPFSARIDVMGSVAKGELSCPSHPVELNAIEGGTRVEMSAGASLDRDFILSIDGLKGESFAVAAPDDDTQVVLASFCPGKPLQQASSQGELSALEDRPLALKILVDCSGSMAGDSIEQAREALDELTRQLKGEDLVSYSRFGSDVKHLATAMAPCTEKFLKGKLAPAILQTQADLGGTELGSSLLSTFAISLPKTHEAGVDLLLITDGDVWDVESIIEQARKSNHRIFAIGVGSAPAESLLRELAEGTGGACELVTPNESMAAAVLRMFERMRSARSVELSINWGQTPLWQSTLPKQVFEDETVHAFAVLQSTAQAAPVLTWQADGQTLHSSAEGLKTEINVTLPRVCAAARIVAMEAAKDLPGAEALAIKYQLASKYTNLILVHVREEGQKAQGLPKLQQIAQMQAAGQGGFGSAQGQQVQQVLRSVSASFQAEHVPSVWRTNRTQSAAKVDALSAASMDDFEIPAFLRKQVDEDLVKATPSSPGLEDLFSPQELVIRFNKLCLTSPDFETVCKRLPQDHMTGVLWTVLSKVAGESDKLGTAWACLIEWLVEKTGIALTRHALRLLNPELMRVENDFKTAARAEFDAVFKNVTSTSWGITLVAPKKSMLQKVKRLLRQP
jgi:Ca-activated chloride channel family protein